MGSGCPHKRLHEAAQQSRREQLLREQEEQRRLETPAQAEQRRREEDIEAANSLILLRAGFGEFGLWGNVPGAVPGTLPLQWQRNYQSLPGARPVTFGPVDGSGSNHQSANPTTTTTTTNSAANIPNAGARNITGNGTGHSHSHLDSSAPARLDTLAAVAASSEPLRPAQETRPLQERTNGCKYLPLLSLYVAERKLTQVQ
ncbi:hypothetical protein SMACR_05721 [Sordaria macrospora]|uniref:WGS project CABT00000000 data, contig 2.30 n=2 Tax=Sordaria macrospora TaxID=5147 RepID=F7W5H5_SORMK|nr:uncharacterized protein SMAC_05721 [Sordaria macrospora k-hell]KAA8632540.1 hypothetical protein SMACR_05721 [Sordaria macrospora]WPJ65472.1 hypothetical protein SMAC4_05721 [Sordaria macrospora]CCC12763.1 unnamed protein product [Sordaria macrospora k-hell]